MGSACSIYTSHRWRLTLSSPRNPLTDFHDYTTSITSILTTLSTKTTDWFRYPNKLFSHSSNFTVFTSLHLHHIQSSNQSYPIISIFEMASKKDDKGKGKTKESKSSSSKRKEKKRPASGPPQSASPRAEQPPAPPRPATPVGSTPANVPLRTNSSIHGLLNRSPTPVAKRPPAPPIQRKDSRSSLRSVGSSKNLASRGRAAPAHIIKSAVSGPGSGQPPLQRQDTGRSSRSASRQGRRRQRQQFRCTRS
jgi:hypothetical protein